MRGIFVTATDTCVGKSVISALLARYLQGKGYSVITQKWIQTGGGTSSADINLHLKLMKKRKEDIKDYLPAMSSYNFKFPSSPHLAASLEKRAIKADKIKKSFKFLLKKFDFVIVEGVGGALVPFNANRLVIDIARELGLPALIVSGNKLGAINHTLLTIEAIKNRDMKILGIVFNNRYKKSNKIISKDNPVIIKRLTGETILGVLPYTKDIDYLYKAFIPVGKNILSRFRRKGK